MRACSYWYVNKVLFSVYSYFRKDCRKAYITRYFGRVRLGLIERQLFVNKLYTAISSKAVAAHVYTPKPQRSM